jgi:transcriptional regulator with XRE-family HTH domain
MKPVALPYPDVLNTLGDHVRKRRLDLGLRQRDVAAQLEVNVMTVNYWETNRNHPSLRMIKRITDFLGYNPNLEAQAQESLGEQIFRIRRALGIRQKDLAREIGVDPGTLAKWERRKQSPSSAHRTRLIQISNWLQRK